MDLFGAFVKSREPLQARSIDKMMKKFSADLKFQGIEKFPASARLKKGHHKTASEYNVGLYLAKQDRFATLDHPEKHQLRFKRSFGELSSKDLTTRQRLKTYSNKKKANALALRQDGLAGQQIGSARRKSSTKGKGSSRRKLGKKGSLKSGMERKKRSGGLSLHEMNFFDLRIS